MNLVLQMKEVPHDRIIQGSTHSCEDGMWNYFANSSMERREAYKTRAPRILRFFFWRKAFSFQKTTRAQKMFQKRAQRMLRFFLWRKRKVFCARSVAFDAGAEKAKRVWREAFSFRKRAQLRFLRPEATKERIAFP